MLPYAGASSMAYYEWKNCFPSDICPIFVELAGRGSRLNEGFYKSIDEAAEDLARFIENRINECEYYIFGHSMGALLAYEIYYKLLENKAKLPKHIFFSGREAANIKHTRIDIDSYDDDVFLRMVSLYGGISSDLYDTESKKKALLPALRADFKILDDYVYQEKKEKIKCDITVMYGKKDFSVNHDNAAQWKYHTDRNFNLYKFNGEHFYINTEYPEVIDIIAKV